MQGNLLTGAIGSDTDCWQACSPPEFRLIVSIEARSLEDAAREFSDQLKTLFNSTITGARFSLLELRRDERPVGGSNVRGNAPRRPVL